MLKIVCPETPKIKNLERKIILIFYYAKESEVYIYVYKKRNRLNTVRPHTVIRIANLLV